MYLKSISIKNIKCFDSIDITLPERNQHGNWHVVVGTNSTGKTTLLQAIAATLIGPHSAGRLIESPSSWVREGEKYGEITAVFQRDEVDGSEGHRVRPYVAELAITGDAPVKIEKEYYAAPVVVAKGKDRKALMRSAWATDKSGWFLTGYGAFRRLSGGSEVIQRAFGTNREPRVASLFREAFALEKSLDWLQRINARASDRHASPEESTRHEGFLKRLCALLNHLLHGRGVEIADVTTEKVIFTTLGGARVSMMSLSDGFRSFLSFVIDLIRNAYDLFGGDGAWIEQRPDGFSVSVPGIVLIDEVDSHLHPVWQREIARKLSGVFPNIQFIVTSHSPIVAQAASDRGLFALHYEKATNRVLRTTAEATVKGWTIDQILTSPLFGLTETRSAEIDVWLKRHALLTGLRISGEISPDATVELRDLEDKLSRFTSPFGDPAKEQRRNLEMDAFIEKTLSEMRGNRP